MEDREGCYCQALIPIPVPLDQIPILNPKQSKTKSPIGTGAYTKITWATTPHLTPPITFIHEGVL